MDKLAPFHLDINDDESIGMTPIIAKELDFSFIIRESIMKLFALSLLYRLLTYRVRCWTE